MCTVHFEEGLRPKRCVIKSKKILVITMQSDPLRSVNSNNLVVIAKTQRAVVRDSPCSSVTPFNRQMSFITCTGNVQFKASKLKVLHENGNHGRADEFRYVAHHLASFITETVNHK